MILPIEDYERVFRVIHGLLLSERGDPVRACLYFGVFGALLLGDQHGLRAAPVVGMAAYRLGDRQLAFADLSGRVLDAKPSGFHCWVETENTLIDFQAPLFPEAIARVDSSVRLPCRMLQKPLSATSDTPLDLATGGTHWLQGNPELHRTLLTEFTDVPANVDLAQIASEWYRPSPAKLREFITVGDGRGRKKTVSLSPIRLDGTW